MSKEDKLIPDLRFPEFVNDGEWDEKKLENYIDLFSGIALKSEELSDDKSGVPILRGINITEGCVRHSKDIDKYYLGDINNLEKYLVKENDIVIGMDGSKVGKNVAMITKKDENSILIQRVARIRINKDADINFVYQYFISDKFINYVDTVNTSSGIPHISAQQIKDSKVGFPPDIKEQQKIASCLSSLDEVITAHTQKLDLLKDHKKGLMQNFFPQEGETVPKVRFKEFEHDGDWVVCKLGNYIDLFSGIALKSEELSDDNSGVPILRGINITEGYVRHSKDIDKYFLGDVANLEKYLVKENDIVIGMDGSKVGKNVAMITKDDENSILIQRVARIRIYKDADINFIYQYFISDKFIHYVDTVNTSSGIPHISAQQIKDSKVGFPPKIKEQQKIASLLSSLDALITAQSEKITQLKLHKKGLMQGLYPKIND